MQSRPRARGAWRRPEEQGQTVAQRAQKAGPCNRGLAGGGHGDDRRNRYKRWRSARKRQDRAIAASRAGARQRPEEQVQTVAQRAQEAGLRNRGLARGGTATTGGTGTNGGAARARGRAVQSRPRARGHGPLVSSLCIYPRNRGLAGGGTGFFRASEISQKRIAAPRAGGFAPRLVSPAPGGCSPPCRRLAGGERGAELLPPGRARLRPAKRPSARFPAGARRRFEAISDRRASFW